MASSQTLVLGRFGTTVQNSLEHLRSQRYVERLWNKDASLWSDDPDVQASIRNRLGWLTIPRVMAAQTASLRTFAQEIRAAGFTHVLLLGMGGSGLFSEVCRKTFGIASSGLELTVLDTTDPTAIRRYQQRCPLQQLLVIISSKSGSTSEVSALSNYFYETFKSADGTPGAHCIAITDHGTSLEAQAATLKYRRAFVHGPTNGADVGGRFSALTYFGLVPASLLGVDVDALLSRAIEMLERCGSNTPLADHPAAQLGAVLGALAAEGRDKMTLRCPPSLESVGTWVEQLVAESTGKLGKGIVPIFGEPLRDVAWYSNDRVFVELQLTSEWDAGLDRHVQALAAAGHPVVRIDWQDRYDLGGEVVKWEMATGIAGSLMGLNPFDEPNVQESKDRTKTLLSQYTKDHRLPDEVPIVSEGSVALYSGASTSPSARSIGQIVSDFFRQRRAMDYIAILSFLPRTATLDQAMEALRNRLSEQLGCATMLGFGPRYLHSTGQLYKGGADNGLFLLFTADDPVDVPIPGEPFSFRVLKQAQALGDFQAMCQHHRRVLRVHVRAPLDAALAQWDAALDEALSALAPRP